ncbi:MAG: succinylglutamate desuccinylase/aspartoacylase family protein [Halarchaeum sp.]
MDYAPVAHEHEELPLGTLPSGTPVTVPVHRYVGGAGPTVHVQALQHGIEVNGPAALRRLHERLLDADVAGTVVVVPVANPLAFDHRSYMTPHALDALNGNLNRVWPGDADGTFQERLAASLWDVVCEADAVVDLHTGSADMLEHARFVEGDADAERLASAFGTSHLLVDADDAPTDDAFSGRLRVALAREDVPAITVELSNSRELAHGAVRRGADGLENVLRALDVLPGSPDDAPDQSVLHDRATDAIAGESGLFEARPGLSVGDRVAAGDELGTVYCPSTFTERETATAAVDGVVYSLTREAVVVVGERLVGVADPVA